MRSVLAVVAVPVVELVVGPWVLTGLHTGHDLPAALQPVGGVVVALALVALVDAYVRLAKASPHELVRSGVYRFVRHPMYIATTTALVGEAFLLRRAVLLAAAAAYAASLFALVRWWEGPQLRRRFPDS